MSTRETVVGFRRRRRVHKSLNQVADAFVTAGLSSIESEIRWRGYLTISVKQDTQREPEKITCAAGRVVNEYRIVIQHATKAYSLRSTDIETASHGHRKAVVAFFQKQIEGWTWRRESCAGVRDTAEHMGEWREARAVARLKLRAGQKIVDACLQLKALGDRRARRSASGNRARG